jgi:hypothetical protein
MDTSALRHYTPGQQRDINLVRLYIQAMTLSDLSIFDGTMIREEALQGTRGLHQKIRTNWRAPKRHRHLPNVDYGNAT